MAFARGPAESAVARPVKGRQGVDATEHGRFAMNARSQRSTRLTGLARSILAGIWYMVVACLALAGLTAFVVGFLFVESGGLNRLALRPAGAERLVPTAPPGIVGSTPLAELTPRPRPVIYLNREGGLLTGGEVDDASRNVSSVIGRAGLANHQAPAFRGTAQRWDEIVACTRQQFAAYDVEVVDQRPVEGDYVMVMVGGQPGELASATGFRSTRQARVTGLAPLGQEPIPDAVVFVFARELGERGRDVCETIAHEAGHAFGLDHVLDCHDPMTHLQRCGQRSFQDEASPCGEQDPRACVDGGLEQSSHQRLLETLGPRASSAE